MNKLIKKIFNNPWIIAVFAPLITAGIYSVWISKKQNINIKKSLLIIYEFIKNIFNHKVSIWNIILFIMLLFILQYIIIFIYRKNKSKSFCKYPGWYYNFNTMNYKEWIFKWNYQIYANTYDIQSLRPICTCECELVRKTRIENIYYNRHILFCPNCHKIYESPDKDTIEELKRLISYNIDKHYTS